MRKKRVTIKDIAEACGVSTATVSHVLNGTAPISPETTAKVLKVVQETNYEPNVFARNLRRRESQTIAFIANTVMSDLVPNMMGGAMQAAVDRGYNLIIGEARQKVGSQAFYQWLVRSHQATGLLFCNNWVTAVNYKVPPHTPVVYLYCFSAEESQDCILPDSVAGGYKAAAHLISLGRRRIAYIGGTINWKCTQDRLTGYRMAHTDAGIAVDESLIDFGDWTAEGGYRAAARLLSSGKEMDAMFVANDLMAVGVMDAIWERGLRVPEDIAIVGYDDIPIAAATRPALTTIRLPNYDMGYTACNLLIDKIEGKPPRRMGSEYGCTLVVRDSCGAGKQRAAY